MTAENDKIGENESKHDDATMTLNLSKLLKIDLSNAIEDITTVKYSNFAAVQIMERDIHIDFLELPGIKKDGKVIINSTRIYLTHAHAQKLALSILNILKKSHKEHSFESYIPDE